MAKVTTANHMFENANSFRGVGLENWKMGKNYVRTDPFSDLPLRGTAAIRGRGCDDSQYSALSFIISSTLQNFRQMFSNVRRQSMEPVSETVTLRAFWLTVSSPSNSVFAGVGFRCRYQWLGRVVCHRLRAHV
jgi:hypothetical protein